MSDLAYAAKSLLKGIHEHQRHIKAEYTTAQHEYEATYYKARCMKLSRTLGCWDPPSRCPEYTLEAPLLSKTRGPIN